ncbi:D-aminoacyl-tRNA deacylase [Galenea microaerophila]
MICLLQRVTQAKVEVAGQTIGQIGQGILVLVGFQKEDHVEKLQKMGHKLLHYRLFADAQDKMNLNVQQIEGDLLLVPQFTLAAETHKGLRPSFSSAAAPEVARQLFAQFVEQIAQTYRPPQTGQFGADMQVSLTNDGPVTFWLEV